MAQARVPALFLVIFAAIAAFLGAVVAALIVAPSAGPAPAPIAQLPAELASELRALHVRIEQLEQRAAPASSSGIAPAPAPLRRSIGADDERLRSIEARLRKLEKAAAVPDAALVTDELSALHRELLRRQPDPADVARALADHQQTILDPNADAVRKLQAWSGLRQHENAWTDPVVSEMVHLGLTSADDDVRANVWRQADARSTHAAMANGLLRALQNDRVASVREEAAESLRKYLSRPDVVAALEYARDNDPDESVRRYAAESLERSKRGR